MLIDLTPEQQNWVKTVFDSMTTEEKLSHLLHPSVEKYTDGELKELVEKYRVGSIFMGRGSHEDILRRSRIVQETSRIPLLISDDMENGSCMLNDKASVFPMQMGLAACEKSEYAYQMGRITSLEARAVGINWTFSPVVDLNLNPNNPITNVRSLGDDPAKTIPLIREIIRGLQEGGLMAAGCKHFPGDGVDDRDQHMVTSCNLLHFDEWMDFYGKVWKAAIEEGGTMSIMAGHISLPDYQKCGDDPDRALPATLSKELQINLLRKQLGFKGVIVSDAFPMAGFTSRFPEEELYWRNIVAGSDSILFSDAEKGFESLKAGLKSGKLTEERVNDAVLNLLCMKARLHLNENCFSSPVSDEDLLRHRSFAEKVACDAVTVLRRKDGLLPVNAEKVHKVLTVTLVKNDDSIPDKALETLDEELRARGLEVDHFQNPGHEKLKKALDVYDKIFINLETQGHAGLQLRLTSAPAFAFWHSFFTDVKAADKIVYTSFGSPYLLYELPFLDNLICVWGRMEVCQKAAVKAWFGEIDMNGVLPVRPQKPHLVTYKS